MRLIDAVPRQPTVDDLASCEVQIGLWQDRYRAAAPETAWAHTCAGILDQWRDLRDELSSALADGGGCLSR